MHIVRGNLADELRNIDVRWAGLDARRVATEEAPIGFNHRCVAQEWKLEVLKCGFSAIGREVLIHGYMRHATGDIRPRVCGA